MIVTKNAVVLLRDKVVFTIVKMYIRYYRIIHEEKLFVKNDVAVSLLN